MFQIISIAGSIIFLLIILSCVRQKKLNEAYAILWVLIGIVVLGVSIVPNVLRMSAQLLGIVYPPAVLFIVLLFGVFVILFQYSILLSKNQERISRLVQEVALLKDELEKLKRSK